MFRRKQNFSRLSRSALDASLDKVNLRQIMQKWHLEMDDENNRYLKYNSF